MGRDWAPFERYLVEQHHLKNGHGDLFDFLESIKFVYENGKEEILNPPEEMTIRRQFPMLGRLLMDDFIELHSRLTKIPGGIDFLHKKDDELKQIIKSFESRKKDFNRDSYLSKWFMGELDEHFYYSERNNEMFVECMISDAVALTREPFDAEKFKAALLYASLEADVEENRDFFEAHANKLIYITENKKDLLDFDFWVRYELLLGEKITWDEYVAIDNQFDGDPHDVEFSHKHTIDEFKASLTAFREGEKDKSSLDENIQSAEDMRSVHTIGSSPKRENDER